MPADATQQHHGDARIAPLHDPIHSYPHIVIDAWRPADRAITFVNSTSQLYMSSGHFHASGLRPIAEAQEEFARERLPAHRDRALQDDDHLHADRQLRFRAAPRSRLLTGTVEGGLRVPLAVQAATVLGVVQFSHFDGEVRPSFALRY
ncbi:hypothetical protein [Pseudoxanthomonas sp. Root630]|uniref:hypothetical protein n=1 Tax=Pseudoxanthomonas sp. Root630 TaxID=1736574 RepID=UPI00138F47A9|nr:hypothetical protein [Pseudoxanthomonas sp. Root630]